jgi:putative FmdB family regulatory protein
MPLYEYECTACHKRTEKIQKFSDPEITVCPHCGGVLERVVSAPAIAFKGGGWYADGYGNAKPKSSGENGGKGSSSDSKPGTDTKSSGDAKPSTDSASTSTPAPAAASAPAPAAAAVSSSDKK